MTDLREIDALTQAFNAPTIDPEFHSLIPALSADELAELEASILAEGCREALAVWQETDLLIDGHNRLAICQRHDLPFNVVYRSFESREDVILWMCRNQLGRRNLTPFARSELVLHMKAAVENSARNRQVETLKRGEEVPVRQNSDERESGRTDEELGKQAKVSRDTIRKVEYLQASALTEVLDALREGELSVNRAYNLTKTLTKLPDEHRYRAYRLCGDEVEKAKTLERLCKSSQNGGSNDTYGEILAAGGFSYGEGMEAWCDFVESGTREIDAALRELAKYHARLAAEAHREEKREQAQSLPSEVFNVIYADPAWEYDNTGLNGAAEHHYGTMPIEDIYALPRNVNLCVADNAVLFLWVTNPFLAEGLECVRRWGFEYKTNLVWVKTNLQKPGVGWYVRGRHELLLIATRGSLTPLENVSPPIGSVLETVDAVLETYGSVLEAPLQEHSRKPDEIYTIIERLYPDCNYVELFARRAREGWAAWGDQVGASTR